MNDIIPNCQPSGGVRPPSPPRHDTTAPEEPVCARASIRLSLFIYLLRTFDPHVFKWVLAYFPLPFRLSVGFFPFWDPIREALSFVNLYFL